MSRRVCDCSLMVEAQTHLTTMFLQFILIIITCCFGVSSSCPPFEYRAENSTGWWCCPSCPPGHHVVKDCTESITKCSSCVTKCSSCPDGTFQPGRNKMKQCCTKCVAGLGLKVKKSCSSTSDAVCEVLDGFFCSDSKRGGCRAAQRHRLSCSPGQYIDQRGTADKDTECLHCTDGTFSNGTSTSCQNHTKCESVGPKLMRPGTDSTDSECGEHGPHAGLERGHVAGIIPGVLLGMALIIIAIILYKKKRETTPLKSSDGPEPSRDQQECTITIPDGTMDDHDDDQSLDPAPPSSPTDNGSVSVSVHQEDNPIVSPSSDECTININDPSVHFKREIGAA